MDMQSNKDDRIVTQTEIEDGLASGKKSKWLPLIAVVVALVGFYLIVSYAYKKGAEQGVENIVPTVAADSEAFKVKPEEPGGMEVPFRETLVFDQLDPENKKDIKKTESILPPPEEPVEIPEEVTTAIEDAEDAIADATAVIGDKADKASEKVETLIAPPVEELKPTAAPKVEEAAKVETVSKEEAKKELNETLNEVIKAVEKVEEKVEPKAEAVKEVVEAAPKPATGTSKVQLASFKDEASATAAWKTMGKKYSPLLEGLNYDVEKADLGEKGTYYRLHVVGLAKDAAKSLCSSIKDKKGSCLVK